MDIPTIDVIKTGQNIRKLRTQVGIKVRDIQEIMGFANPIAIYKWEQGRTLPRIDNLVVLAKIFNVSMDEIVICRRV